MRACRDAYAENPLFWFDAWLDKWPLAKQHAIRMSIERAEAFAPDRCQADVKRECLVACPTKARLIQYYFNLATQAAFGPQFYSLQKTVTNLLRRYPMGRSDVTFGSGMNSGQIGAWMHGVVADGAVCYYERDGKCWDATMSRAHARLRVRMYREVDPALADFAAACVRVVVTYKDAGRRRSRVLKYKLDSTVKSGHNDTTLGNSLINAAIILAVLEELCIRGSILVAGDDLVVALYDRVALDVLIAAESRFGIRPVARIFDDPEDVSFTSGIFVRHPAGFHFIPKPGKLLAKLWWTVTPVAVRHRRAYSRGVAYGLLPTCRDIPVVRAFLDPFECASASVALGRGYRYRGVGVSHDFMGWFCRRYSTYPDQVLRLEVDLRARAGQAVFVSHPLLERMILVDEADIGGRETVGSASEG